MTKKRIIFWGKKTKLLVGVMILCFTLGVFPSAKAAENVKEINNLPSGSKIITTEDTGSIEVSIPQVVSSDAVSGASVFIQEKVVLDTPLSKGENMVHFRVSDGTEYTVLLVYNGQKSEIEVSALSWPALTSSEAHMTITSKTITQYDDGTETLNTMKYNENGVVESVEFRKTVPDFVNGGKSVTFIGDYRYSGEHSNSEIIYDENEKIISRIEEYNEELKISDSTGKYIFVENYGSGSVNLVAKVGVNRLGFTCKNGTVSLGHHELDTIWGAKLEVPRTVKIPAVVVNGEGDERTVGVAYTTAKVTKVSDNAYYQWGKSIKQAVIAGNVEKIGDNAFRSLENLTTVTIGNSVKTIGVRAFRSDKKLKKITIGKGVTKIGKKAFKGDILLKNITIKSTAIKSIGKEAFKGISSKAVIKLSGTKKQKTKIKKLIRNSGISKSVKIK